jgi:hypothetical protein
VKSVTTDRFRKAYRNLPPHVKRQARRAYAAFKSNPSHQGLQLKQVHPTELIFSARVSLGYRALAVREDDTWIWFWIGSHADYDRLISQR